MRYPGQTSEEWFTRRFEAELTWHSFFCKWIGLSLLAGIWTVDMMPTPITVVLYTVMLTFIPAAILTLIVAGVNAHESLKRGH